MKALLAEHTKSGNPVIILIPSGKREPDIGDPANVALDLNGDDLRVWVLDNKELVNSSPFKIIRETDVDDHLLLKALDYRNARVEYEREKVELKGRLLNEKVTPHCEALIFLDFGALVL